MSESMNTRRNRRDFRWQLLATVSALALLAGAYESSEAEAADQDADRPTVWVELGGQLDRMSDSQETFSPPFMASITQTNLLSALNVQQPPNYAFGEEGKISFQPDGSNWVFSASMRYGRSQATRARHQQTNNAMIPVNFTAFSQHLGPYSKYPSGHVKFADGQAAQSESHAILDFQAGKDVGLGMFGGRGSSVLSAGVRIAQFSSKTNALLRAIPDLQYPTAPVNSFAGFVAFLYAPIHFHGYTATANIQHSFRGVGPSLTWNASMPFAGNAKSAELTFDWGANAAVLFGRQKTSGHHQTITKTYSFTRWVGNKQDFRGYSTIGHFTANGSRFAAAQHTHPANISRERSVTVPNFGGFAGVSLKWPNAKISLGYRADFFFGAVDGGIDVAKKENRGFNGPYATISVGIGG